MAVYFYHHIPHPHYPFAELIPSHPSSLFIQSILIAIPLHIALLISASVFAGINIEQPLSLFWGVVAAKKTIPEMTSALFYFYWVEIIGYLFCAVIVGAMLGYAFGHVIFKEFSLDRKFRIFRIPNRWYYDFGVGEGVTWINALVHIGGKPFIYSGGVVGFSVDKDGNLVDLTLDQSERRPFGSHGKSFTSIPGQKVIVKYDHVINMNITVFPLSVKKR